MASLGVAVIGTGFMGKCHAMAWSHVRTVFGGNTDIRLEVLCDTNAEVTKQKAAEAGFRPGGNRLAAASWRQPHRRCVDHHAQQPAPGNGGGIPGGGQACLVRKAHGADA